MGIGRELSLAFAQHRHPPVGRERVVKLPHRLQLDPHRQRDGRERRPRIVGARDEQQTFDHAGEPVEFLERRGEALAILVGRARPRQRHLGLAAQIVDRVAHRVGDVRGKFRQAV
jgi:hypothetical protein